MDRTGVLLLAIATTQAWLGCNLVTGADGIVIGDDDDASEAQGGGSTGHASGGGGGAAIPGTGNAGTGNAGNEGTGNAGAGSTTTSQTGPTGSGAGGTTTTSSVGDGGSGAGPTDCPWPQGTSGITEGRILPETLSWQGYRAHSSTLETIRIDDYYDCDGSRGIRAVLLLSQSWNCPACQLEASELESNASGWAALGIEVVVLLMQGGYGEPATPQLAQIWRDYWGLESVAVVADPSFLLITPDSGGIPQTTLVDPRTMEVVDVDSGYDGTFPELLALAQQNGA